MQLRNIRKSSIVMSALLIVGVMLSMTDKSQAMFSSLWPCEFEIPSVACLCSHPYDCPCACGVVWY